MISTELMARLAGRHAKVTEVDVQHLPRMTGEQSGANLKVVGCAFKELIALYRELKAERIGVGPGVWGNREGRRRMRNGDRQRIRKAEYYSPIASSRRSSMTKLLY